LFRIGLPSAVAKAIAYQVRGVPEETETFHIIATGVLILTETFRQRRRSAHEKQCLTGGKYDQRFL